MAVISVMKVVCSVMCVGALVVLAVVLAVQGGWALPCGLFRGCLAWALLDDAAASHIKLSCLMPAVTVTEPNQPTHVHHVRPTLRALRCHCAAGRLPEVRWLPDPAFFGEGLLTRAKNILAIIPVMMTAYLCHMSLHPLVQDLHNYTPRRMRRVRGPCCAAMCRAMHAALHSLRHAFVAWVRACCAAAHPATASWLHSHSLITV